MVTTDGKEGLLYAYHPQRQVTVCGDVRECIEGAHPTLAEIRASHGEGTSAAWLVQQLFNLSEFCGCKGKLSNEALEELAHIITNEFYYLKVTELMLFFYRFKLGHFGKFYGSVDPVVILSSIRQFVLWRNMQIDRYEGEERQRRMDEWRRTAISREEYERRKRIRHERERQGTEKDA